MTIQNKLLLTLSLSFGLTFMVACKEPMVDSEETETQDTETQDTGTEDTGTEDTGTEDTGTEDTTAPQLVGSSVDDGAVGVSVSENTLRLSFDEEVYWGEVGTVSLVGDAGPLLAGEAYLDVLDLIVDLDSKLNEFETNYVFSVSGLVDAAGNEMEPLEIHFQTEAFDPQSFYFIQNAQFDLKINLWDNGKAYLSSGTDGGSYWVPEPRGDGTYVLRSGFFGPELALEGADQDSEPLMADGLSSGQIWYFPKVGSREAEIGESQSNVVLSNLNHGDGQSLGVGANFSDDKYAVGMEYIGYLDQAWYFVNAGPR